MGITVRCKATQEGEEDCPFLHYCIPRLLDRTIKGCGLYLACEGLIAPEDIRVLHEIKQEEKL